MIEPGARFAIIVARERSAKWRKDASRLACTAQRGLRPCMGLGYKVQSIVGKDLVASKS